MTLGKALSHHQPRYCGVYTPCSHPSAHLILIISPGVGQSTTYNSHFIEGETEAQEGRATSLPKAIPQVSGLARCRVCLTPHRRPLPHRGRGESLGSKSCGQGADGAREWTAALWSAPGEATGARGEGAGGAKRAPVSVCACVHVCVCARVRVGMGTAGRRNANLRHKAQVGGRGSWANDKGWGRGHQGWRWGTERAGAGLGL